MTETAEKSGKSDEASNELDFATAEKQRARAFLRERFLRVITGIVGEQAEFHLHEKTRVVGEFRGCDVDCSEVYVRDMETPLGRIPEAVLRATDIIQIDLNGLDPVPE